MARLLDALWRWLNDADADLYMPASWLNDYKQVQNYELYTRAQHDQGCVIKDVERTRQDAFWKAQELKKQKRRLKVVGGRDQ